MRTSLGLLFMVLIVGASSTPSYKQALPGYPYRFPQDNFDHPDYQTEWWYYTGNVKASDGHRFGYELTFFRQAVARDAAKSPWQVNDLYMAHLALSDISGKRFYHSERVNRAGPGIAGVSEQSGQIWNGNWQAQLSGAHQVLKGIDTQFALQLDLRSAKPPIINGRDGVSQKSEGAGHASHYISLTRLLTQGSIEVGGVTYKVDGSSWMDHEFFSESTGSNESGWDWISVQFADNTELMLYRLRHKDGSVDPYSSGTYIDAQGKSSFLSSQQFTMSAMGETWTSPVSKANYPIRWKVSIPAIGLEAQISTPLAQQELTNNFLPTYWEGATDISGTKAGQAVRGVGYLEMTGYSNGQNNQVTIP